MCAPHPPRCSTCTPLLCSPARCRRSSWLTGLFLSGATRCLNAGRAACMACGRRTRPRPKGDSAVMERTAQAACDLSVPRRDRKPLPMLDDLGAHIANGAAFVLEAGGIPGCIILLPAHDAPCCRIMWPLSPRPKNAAMAENCWTLQRRSSRRGGCGASSSAPMSPCTRISPGIQSRALLSQGMGRKRTVNGFTMKKRQEAEAPDAGTCRQPGGAC